MHQRIVYSWHLAFFFFLGQVVLDVSKNRSPAPFVIQWISRHIPDIDKWRSFIPDTQHSPNQAAVNELLDQFFSNSAFPARYMYNHVYSNYCSRALTLEEADQTSQQLNTAHNTARNL